MTLNMQDAALSKDLALPNGAASTTSTPIDLEVSARADFLTQCEVLITAPALVVGDLADTETMKYELISADNSSMTSPTTHGVLITQTGAGGAGAAGTSARARLPSNVGRYVAIKATNSGSGDASDKTANIKLLF